jgi:hypothetical protein
MAANKQTRRVFPDFLPDSGTVMTGISSDVDHPYIGFFAKKTTSLRIDFSQSAPVDISRDRHQRPENGQLTGNFQASDISSVPDFVDIFKKTVQSLIQVTMRVRQQADPFQF